MNESRGDREENKNRTKYGNKMAKLIERLKRKEEDR